MGFGGLFLIVLVIDYCCYLIVKIKYYVIRYVIELYKVFIEFLNGVFLFVGDNDVELFFDDEDDDIVIYDVDEVLMIE